MILGIAATQNAASSPVDLHFGRCRWFCIYHTVTGETRFVENCCSNTQEHAGVNTVELLKQHGVTAVVAGRFGYKVVDVLKSSGVQLIIAHRGQTIEDIINRTK